MFPTQAAQFLKTKKNAACECKTVADPCCWVYTIKIYWTVCLTIREHAVAQFVETLHYKPDGRGFDGVIGVDSASFRKEYQEYFLWGKGGRCVRLTTLPPSCVDCLEIWEPQPPGILRACPDLHRDWFTKLKIQRDSKRWTQFLTSIFPEIYMVCERSTSFSLCCIVAILLSTGAAARLCARRAL
jgi:hypothetical protein